MITRQNLTRLILSVFSVLAFIQFQPSAASAQVFTCPAGFTCVSATSTLPVFSITGTPTFVQQNITVGGATTTATQYIATYNISVYNPGAPTVLGLPNSTNPAFGGVNVPTNIAQLYVNSLPAPNNNNIQVIAYYGPPSNTVISNSSTTFIIAPNQTVTIPVSYSFVVRNQGANTYGLVLSSGVYSQSTTTPPTYVTTPISGPNCAGACPVIPPITNPTVIPASAKIYAPTTLALTYNSQQQESLLTATFEVGVNGGTQGVNVYKNNAGGIFYSNSTQQQSYTNSQDVVSFVPLNSNVATVNDNYGQVMYVVPAGQLVVFKEVITTNPQQLFAGTYYAGMSVVFVNSGTNISSSYYMNVPIVKSNLVTVVGELGPYIASVNSPVAQGQVLTITGQRLTGSQIFIDKSVLSNVIISGPTNGTSLAFTVPRSVAQGIHTLYVSNSIGASNQISFTVAGSVSTSTSTATTTASSTAPSITITSPSVGQSIQQGQVVSISWIAKSLPSRGTYSINVYNGPTASIAYPNTTIASGINTNSYSWTVVPNTGNWGVGMNNVSNFFAALFGIKTAEASSNQYTIQVCEVLTANPTGFYVCSSGTSVTISATNPNPPIKKNPTQNTSVDASNNTANAFNGLLDFLKSIF